MRSISAVIIVLTHVLQVNDIKWAFFTNSAVATFMIMSGYLHSKKYIDNPILWIKKKIKRVLIPYYTFIIFAIPASYFIFKSFNFRGVIIYALGLQGFFNFEPNGIGNLWFITAILVAYMLTPLYINSNFYIKLLISIILFILFYIGLVPFGIASSIYCYLIGLTFPSLLTKKSNFLLFISIIFLVFFLLEFELVNYGLVSLVRTPILGIILFYLLYQLDLSNFKKTLNIISNYSYELYLTHGIITFALVPFGTTIFRTLIWACLLVLLPIILKKVSTKKYI
ncbi:acyltransferase family protein [Vagococcus fluvialis]|uniref:acyltransferase family protein n=1 Tax=Vagococcus fluvialis TaxID=2738 RepID=UPI001A8EA59F|nr:acyltransferase family protein [Vagococcus fluvialis]